MAKYIKILSRPVSLNLKDIDGVIEKYSLNTLCTRITSEESFKLLAMKSEMTHVQEHITLRLFNQTIPPNHTALV